MTSSEIDFTVLGIRQEIRIGDKTIPVVIISAQEYETLTKRILDLEEELKKINDINLLRLLIPNYNE